MGVRPLPGPADGPDARVVRCVAPTGLLPRPAVGRRGQPAVFRLPLSLVAVQDGLEMKRAYWGLVRAICTTAAFLSTTSTRFPTPPTGSPAH